MSVFSDWWAANKKLSRYRMSNGTMNRLWKPIHSFLSMLNRTNAYPIAYITLELSIFLCINSRPAIFSIYMRIASFFLMEKWKVALSNMQFQKRARKFINFRTFFNILPDIPEITISSSLCWPTPFDFAAIFVQSNSQLPTLKGNKDVHFES